MFKMTGLVAFPNTAAAPSMPIQATAWNGPICFRCNQGYLGTHDCDLIPISCPDGRENCRAPHYGHKALAPVKPTLTLRLPDPAALAWDHRADVRNTLADAVREATGERGPVGVDLLPEE